MANPTVKGSAASGEQVANMRLCCQIGKTMGASTEQLAGALATMMQESSCQNLHGGDRDSAGLYQQRPSQGWGSYAQVTTQWLPESRRDVGIIMGSSDFTDATMSTSGSPFALKTTTRTEPYEFSRGSANQREDSWTCIGRLAQEVQWARFMRGGVLYFASENWLAQQTPRFVFAEGARGVLSITHSSDARQIAAEATVHAVATRWSVLPGDAVRVTGQGPGDGLWLVASVRRDIAAPTSEIILKRPVAELPEPAAPTSSKTVGVGGLSVNRLGASAIGGGAAAGPAQAQALYNACQAISDKHYPYVWGGGHGSCGTPSGGGYDCSGSVCAALGAAHLGYRIGGPVDVSGTMASNFGQPGQGKYFTVWASTEHVWIQLKGLGPAWRFDTSEHGCGPEGAQLRSCPRGTESFTARHWPGL